MTRACAFCQIVLGEVCPQCGQPPAIKMVFKGIAYLCLNLNCSVGWFTQGTGGVSHGLCAACERIEGEKLFRFQQHRRNQHTRFARGTQ